MRCAYILEWAIRKNTMSKCYTELLLLPSYYERLNYLRCQGAPFRETFGPNRYFNQAFYRSNEWKRIRREVILRDNGCDLGIPDLPIRGKIMIHHLNPITLEDIYDGNEILVDLENLICCSIDTHNAIHFKEQSPDDEYRERTANDMCPWRK